VEGHLDRLGILERFDTLVCRDEEVPAKPEPTSWWLACTRLGADPHRSVAVEDSPNGVAAAVSAGLFTVAVPHGMTAGLDLSPAHLVVDSLAEVSLAGVLGVASRR
jgi:beta-phosphoglucomutase-like phosphatase (HAD superfamily)